MKRARQYLHQVRDRYIRWLASGVTRNGCIAQSEAEGDALRQIAVVVTVHDAPEVTDRCLKSLKRYGREAEIVIVDDGSRDPKTSEILQGHQQENDWKLIRNEEAKGHSRACEQGVLKTTRDIVCLLNSDTVLTPFSWAGIVASFEQDENVAVVGPSTSHASTAQCLHPIEDLRFDWSDDEIACFARRYTSSYPDWPLVKSIWRPQIDRDEISGFAFCIRRGVWDLMDGFDARLPDYGNESDLCRRIRAAGYRLLWTRKSYIHHLGKQTYGIRGMDWVSRRRVYADTVLRHSEQAGS